MDGLGVSDGDKQAVISLQDAIEQEEVIALYRANEWSSADKPT